MSAGAEQEWDGLERRRKDDPRWEAAERRMEILEGRIKDLDDGQLHVIKQQDAMLLRFDGQDDMLAQGGKIMQRVLDQTVELRNGVERARWTARLLRTIGHGIAVALRWLADHVNVLARWLAPILAAVATGWALVWAYLNGMPPK